MECSKCAPLKKGIHISAIDIIDLEAVKPKIGKRMAETHSDKHDCHDQ